MSAFRVICFVVLTGCALAASDAENYIVGGRPARPGQFPHLVSLRYRNQHFCGATIIHRFWLLTSAACVFGGPKGIPSQIFAYVGAHTRQDGRRYGISKIQRHPKWDRRLHTNNIAVLQTKGNMLFESGRVAACRLPGRDHTEINPNMPVYMAGWGAKNVSYW